MFDLEYVFGDYECTLDGYRCFSPIQSLDMGLMAYKVMYFVRINENMPIIYGLIMP